jgi:hypothetical protein
LKKVTDLICAIVANAGEEKKPLLLGNEAVPVSWLQDVDKLTHNLKWGRVSFFHPEYEYINNCAYFDYQRDKVFVRTSQTLKKRKKAKRPGSHNNRKLRVSRRLQITSSTCPFCNSDSISNSPVQLLPCKATLLREKGTHSLSPQRKRHTRAYSAPEVCRTRANASLGLLRLAPPGILFPARGTWSTADHQPPHLLPSRS